jgi:hypothetical protein
MSVPLPFEWSEGARVWTSWGSGEVDTNGNCDPLCGTFAYGPDFEFVFEQFSEGRLRTGDREVEVGPSLYGDVRVTRRVFVPASGDYARILDVLENPTDTDILLPYRLDRDFYSPAGGDFVVYAKSTPGPDVTVADAYVVASVPGGRVAAVVLGGTSRPTPPDELSWGSHSGGIGIIERWTTPIRVPANGRAILMQFFVQRLPGEEAAAALQAQMLTNPPAEALAGLTAQDKADLVNFVVP